MNFTTSQRLIVVATVLLSALYLFDIGSDYGTGDVVKSVLFGLVGVGFVYGYHRFIEKGTTGDVVSIALAAFMTLVGLYKLFLYVGFVIATATIGTLVLAIVVFVILYLIFVMVENAVMDHKERKALKAERESYGLPAEPKTPPAGATAVEEPTR